MSGVEYKFKLEGIVIFCEGWGTMLFYKLVELDIGLGLVKIKIKLAEGFWWLMKYEYKAEEIKYGVDGWKA